jgi:hypothetical protein
MFRAEHSERFAQPFGLACFPIVPSDSDFSTLVLLATPLYNPLKKQQYLRSQEDVRLGAFPERHKTQWTHFSHRRFLSSGWPSAAF